MILMLINPVTNRWIESLFSVPCCDKMIRSWVNSNLQNTSLFCGTSHSLPRTLRCSADSLWGSPSVILFLCLFRTDTWMLGCIILYLFSLVMHVHGVKNSYPFNALYIFLLTWTCSFFHVLVLWNKLCKGKLSFFGSNVWKETSQSNEHCWVSGSRTSLCCCWIPLLLQHWAFWLLTKNTVGTTYLMC